MAVTYRTRRPDGRAGPMAGPEPGHRPDSDSDAAPACGDPGRLEWGLPSDLDRHSSHVSDTAELRLGGGRGDGTPGAGPAQGHPVTLGPPAAVRGP